MHAESYSFLFLNWGASDLNNQPLKKYKQLRCRQVLVYLSIWNLTFVLLVMIPNNFFIRCLTLNVSLWVMVWHDQLDWTPCAIYPFICKEEKNISLIAPFIVFECFKHEGSWLASKNKCTLSGAIFTINQDK